jgi:DHA1 family bicyclomycin/chloramphenicol resistance-like MFS transporter
MNHRVLIVVLAALSMLGALSIDAYLPALPTLAREFSITEPVAQQSLSAYMIGYAFMTLFYGTLSDSFGRRRIILFGLVMFIIGSLGSAAAPTFGWLCLFRLLQGLSGGAGQVVGRAMVSDLFTGKDAQKVVSLVSLVFGVAPAFAPIIGGWLLEAFGWRSIFLSTALFSSLLCTICYLFLQESLPVEKRHPFHFKLIVRHYVSAASHRHFM